MKEIPLTQGKIAIVDDEDYELVSEFKWKYSNRGYAARNYYTNGKYRTVLMHRLIMNSPKGYFIDHIDGNPLDNRKINLRIVTNRQNCLNQKLSKRNTSGYKGVTKRRGYERWTAYIRGFNSEKLYLGEFDNPHDAARMYNFWANDIYGEYARLNIIKQ